MNKFLNVLFLFGILFSLACQKKYDTNVCDTLMFEGYKGSPKSAHEHQKSCQNIKSEYSVDLCQKALLELIRGLDTPKMKELYGERIMECFTENDLTKFQKK